VPNELNYALPWLLMGQIKKTSTLYAAQATRAGKLELAPALFLFEKV
jgi:hypothetical protein